MKPISALLAFFFLLFAFTTIAEFVFDSDGEPLLNGGEYYLSAADPIGGPVISSAAIRRGTTQDCSLAVVAALYKPAWSTIISSPYRIRYITTDLPLNISFAHLPPNICTNTSEWLVIDSEPLGQTVMVGDAKEFLEPVVEGWFYIKPYDSKYYKLIFSTKSHSCVDITVHADDENEHYNRLVVRDINPLVFKFDKVKESSQSGISTVV